MRTRTHWSRRLHLQGLLAGVALSIVSCQRFEGIAPASIDLAGSLGSAELRPSPAGFSTTQMTLGGRTAVVIVGPAASRITWTLRVPARAAFSADVAVTRDCPAPAAARFSVGISDGRTYEEIWQAAVPAGQPDAPQWTGITVDLGAYGGTKLSLFYHPDLITWRLIANTRPASPGDCVAHTLWASPRVDAR